MNDVTADPNVMKFYGNGFQCGATLADGSIMIKQNENPVCLITMSLPALKSLHKQIGDILEIYKKNFKLEISNFEELTDRVKSEIKK